MANSTQTPKSCPLCCSSSVERVMDDTLLSARPDGLAPHVVEVVAYQCDSGHMFSCHVKASDGRNPSVKATATESWFNSRGMILRLQQSPNTPELGALRSSRHTEDAGRSGLVLRERPGRQALLTDVVSDKVPYKAILVYDVSQLGSVSGQR